MKPLLLALLAGTAPKAAAIIGQPFDLALQQTTALPTTSTPVSITLQTVNDSRCPVGVQCIVAGYATVEVALADATPNVQTVRIGLHTNNLPDYPTDSVRVMLNQRPYSLLLLDVTPYPGAANGNDTKTARLCLRAR